LIYLRQDHKKTPSGGPQRTPLGILRIKDESEPCCCSPELTWRDVQHLVMWTAEHAPLSDNSGWQRNAAGSWINTRFGFGLMNAHGLVTMASNWTTVPPKSICTVPALPV